MRLHDANCGWSKIKANASKKLDVIPQFSICHTMNGAMVVCFCDGAFCVLSRTSTIRQTAALRISIVNVISSRHPLGRSTRLKPHLSPLRDHQHRQPPNILVQGKGIRCLAHAIYRYAPLYDRCPYPCLAKARLQYTIAVYMHQPRTF